MIDIVVDSITEPQKKQSKLIFVMTYKKYTFIHSTKHNFVSNTKYFLNIYHFFSFLLFFLTCLFLISLLLSFKLFFDFNFDLIIYVNIEITYIQNEALHCEDVRNYMLENYFYLYDVRRCLLLRCLLLRCLLLRC